MIEGHDEAPYEFYSCKGTENTAKVGLSRLPCGAQHLLRRVCRDELLSTIAFSGRPDRLCLRLEAQHLSMQRPHATIRAE
eukprot:5396327-Prymnesium_polylepis.1